jgi:hypothetical protein
VLCLVSVTALAAAASEGELKLKGAEIFERSIDFMVTLDLALFAVVGFFAKDGLFIKGGNVIHRGLVLLLALFAITAVGSLFCGYLTRMEIVAQVSYSGTFYAGGFNEYTVQAWLLVAAAFCAAWFVAIALKNK